MLITTRRIPRIEYIRVISYYDPIQENSNNDHESGPMKLALDIVARSRATWRDPQKDKDISIWFLAKGQAWLRSQEHHEFMELLAGLPLPKITNVIGFGLGLPSNFEDFGCEYADSASIQHFMLREICKYIETITGGPVPCFTQELDFQPIDWELLAEHGTTPVGDPFGSLKLDDHSAVLSIAPAFPIKQIISDIAKPALVIWNRIQDTNFPVDTHPSYL